jgi:undecaprenyl-diphosphatase
MNMEIFRLINSMAGRSRALDGVMIFLSKDAPYIFVAILAALFLKGVLSWDQKSRQAAFSTFIFTALCLGISSVIGHVYYVDRPFVHNRVNLLFPHAADASFPSDHATGTMGIAYGTAESSRLLSSLLTALSLAVGFSRVYVGHHYPADVIGAYAIVYAAGFLYSRLLRGKVEKLYSAAEGKALGLLKLKSGSLLG